MPVIGILAAPPPPYTENVSAIRRGLNEAGFDEGRNVAIEFRWAEGQLDRLPAFAADLVKRQVAVIITVGGAAPLAAAKNATITIPIIFHMGADPVRLGFVKSFNRPGGNVTGISLLQVAMAAKRLEVLRELVPAAKIIGLLTNPANPNVETVVPDLHDTAHALGLRSSLSDMPAAKVTLTSHSKVLLGVAFKHFWSILMRSFSAAGNKSLPWPRAIPFPPCTSLECMLRKAAS